MARLMNSVSGVRGIYNEGLDDTLAEKFAFAFGKLYGSPVVVGRDSRISGPALSRAVISGLNKAGIDAVDIGLASTPTTELAVTEQRAAGGVIVTASHNPREWNGLKFLGPEGIFLNASEGADLLKKFDSLGNVENYPHTGKSRTWDEANEHHIRSILDLDIIDCDLIASAGLTVCFDSVNGAGGPICAEMLERLGCRVYALNSAPTGDFAHNPEPVPDHICALADFVKEKGADIGFAVDPDVDRLSIVNEKGDAIGEEYTLALAADYILKKSNAPAACNLSTSRMIDDVAGRHGVTVHRSPVGEIHVVELMRKITAVIGGEGNGGIILPALHYGRDAVLGMALILQYMAEYAEKISTLADAIPKYHMIKEKVEITSKNAWRDPMKAAFEKGKLDERDGIKIMFPKSWVHVRESNTEPVVRIIAEAPSMEETRTLVQKVRDILNSL